ncbi:MAG: hypothetical protein M2R45_03627 [Verrucomicrobia subdivision 3 bacterium]|nr:hypothetical protein [Limisphaerales bacterium]MCS1416877.1 hypothetical protein [Limisphaerales bacterium]
MALTAVSREGATTIRIIEHKLKRALTSGLGPL